MRPERAAEEEVAIVVAPRLGTRHAGGRVFDFGIHIALPIRSGAFAEVGLVVAVVQRYGKQGRRIIGRPKSIVKGDRTHVLIRRSSYFIDQVAADFQVHPAVIVFPAEVLVPTQNQVQVGQREAFIFPVLGFSNKSLTITIHG